MSGCHFVNGTIVHHRTLSFDLDMFTEVDDEYWQPEDPAQAFRQPAGVPSRIEAFTLWVKLTQIVAFVLRTIVCRLHILHSIILIEIF